MNAAQNPTPVVFTLHDRINADGALFNVTERVDNGPIMTGSFDLGEVRVPLSGFFRVAESGREYLSLSLGSEGGVHYYGKLFRVVDKKYANAPDYTGFVTLLACTEADKYTDDVWESAAKLQVFGRRRRSTDGTARIALTLVSSDVQPDETAF